MSISISGPTGVTIETDPLALKLTGGTLSGKLTGTATATNAALNVGTLTANPSSLANGDIWIVDRLNFVNRLGNTIGVVTTNQVNTISTASAASAILTVNQDGNGGALRVINKGTGYSFLVEDESPESSPFSIDSNGNVGVATLVGQTQGAKMYVNGDFRSSQSVFATTLWAAGNIYIGGTLIQQVVANFLFSGSAVKQGIQGVNGSVSYTDSNGNFYYTGGGDANGNTIGEFTYQNVPYSIAWNGSIFETVTDPSNATWPSATSSLLSFTDSNFNTVHVEADGSGGWYYNPPSQ